MTNTILNFIDGEYREPESGSWLDNVCPADGTISGTIADSNTADVQSAYRAASKAFESWSETTVDQRCSILMKIADLIDQNLEALSVAESEDSGKPVSRARSIEIPRAASNFRFFASAITQFASESHESVG